MKTRLLPIASILLVLISPVVLSQETPDNPRIADLRAQQERRDNPVTQEDILILNGALALLSEESAWNRADDRVCEDDESKGVRSLFCALQKANIDILGEYDHRRVALQEVRFAIQDATNNRRFEHRLRDFNNLPETTLSDIRSVLEVATEKVALRLKNTN